MDILVSKKDGVLTIEFNRPQKRNSITKAMYKIMGDALVEAERDKAVRVILFCGKPDIFSAGNDFQDLSAPEGESWESPGELFVENLSQAKKPVIAAVAGIATGIATTMLFHCDQVYAADNARFSMPFVKLGLCTEFGSNFLLPRIAGHQWAAELLMFGEAFSAEHAFRVGMVNKVLPVAELLPYACAQAAKLAALPASSVQTVKRLMKGRYADTIREQILEERKCLRALLQSPEAKEAIAAFAEKRKPDFTKF